MKFLNLLGAKSADGAEAEACTGSSFSNPCHSDALIPFQ